jgi:hypothetical protein
LFVCYWFLGWFFFLHSSKQITKSENITSNFKIKLNTCILIMSQLISHQLRALLVVAQWAALRAGMKWAANNLYTPLCMQDKAVIHYTTHFKNPTEYGINLALKMIWKSKKIMNTKTTTNKQTNKTQPNKIFHSVIFEIFVANFQGPWTWWNFTSNNNNTRLRKLQSIHSRPSIEECG